MPTPHKLNTPGDFYVEDGCCMCCDVPMIEAPGMFKYDAVNHCYVCKQPRDSDDVEAMIKTIRNSETECIYYRGEDPEIVRRLHELALERQCDSTVVRQSQIVELKSPFSKRWWGFR